MSLHPPKRISSIIGIGLPNTTKQLDYYSPVAAIGTEIWNDMSEPWREGSVIIAQPGYIWKTKWQAGKPYTINKFYDDQQQLVATYCDVARPTEAVDGGFEFDDLYLDIWWIPGHEAIVLDEDELEAALEAGYITQKEANAARLIADHILEMIHRHDPEFDF
jgi:predicted RNA-binding protein associated with RNAse of E/G family